MIHFKETAWGFEFGVAKVNRLISDEKKGWVIIGLKTPKYKNGIEIYVTKTGKVRIFHAGIEWFPAQGG